MKIPLWTVSGMWYKAAHIYSIVHGMTYKLNLQKNKAAKDNEDHQSGCDVYRLYPELVKVLDSGNSGTF